MSDLNKIPEIVYTSPPKYSLSDIVLETNLSLNHINGSSISSNVIPTLEESITKINRCLPPLTSICDFKYDKNSSTLITHLDHLKVSVLHTLLKSNINPNEIRIGSIKTNDIVDFILKTIDYKNDKIEKWIYCVADDSIKKFPHLQNLTVIIYGEQN